MEPISFASLTLGSILTMFPINGEVVTKPTITTHISPAIAGQWEIDLDSSLAMTEEARAKEATPDMQAYETNEPLAMADDGVLTQFEKGGINIQDNDLLATASASNQCREIYNFGADNEMRTVSGDEWTYGQYLVSHHEGGLPVIAISTIHDNNEVDCSGNQVDQTGESLIAFLDHNGSQMQWCADPEGQECFMKFHRVLP